MTSDTQDKSAVNEKIVEAAEVELGEATLLAFLRSELALHRTLLAWIRTALALMAAGIAYDKGFRFLHAERLAEGTAWSQNAHVVGITVIGISTVLLALVTVSYFLEIRAIAAARNGGVAKAVPTLLAALLVIVLGCTVLAVLVVTG